MTVREWHTYHQGPSVLFGGDFDFGFWTAEQPLGGFRTRAGDIVTHILMDWEFHTLLYGNAETLEKQPFPMVVGVSYSPENNSMASWSADGDQGEGLATTLATWERHPWTDGTTHSTQWTTRSLVPLYSNTSREVHDPETDRLHFSAGMQAPSEWDGATGEYFRPQVWGFIRLRILILHNQFG